ncbi:MAG TPA: restriction endonuclease subunit S [Nitrososphaera sp.]|jgi:restriction endonuclease S subunit|nr:restriction endonuclease subunit S [Nitrososphaera sp.]
MLDGSYGILPPSTCYDINESIIFVRATDLGKDLTVNWATALRVPQEYFKNIRARIQQHDVLLAVKGATIASAKSVCFVDLPISNTIINGSIFRITPLPSILPKYLAYILDSDTTKKQMRLNLIANNAIDYLDKTLIHNLLIPFPNEKTQQSIIEKLDKAYRTKAHKETEAQTLLATIDDYVLAQLGVESPDAQDNSLQSRLFYIKANTISGMRFDPDYLNFKSKVTSCKFPLLPLGQLLKKRPQYGANEIGLERTDNQQPLYIRITDIDEWGKLRVEGLGKTATNAEQKYILNDNDLLFARSGNTVGKCYLHKQAAYDNACFFAGYMIRFVVKETEVLPDYIFCFTRTQLYKHWVKGIKRTAGQPNINAEEYQSLLIPLPPFEIQKEIASHVEEIYVRAQQLRDEGQAIIEQAKQEVEAMILGYNV